MCKKQLLKLGNGRKGKVIGCAVLSLALVGTIGGGTMAAGNITDRPYSSYSTSGYTTHKEDKWDDSSAYIRHDGNVDINVEVQNNGTNYSANGSSYYVKKGTSRYLPNYVYERNQSQCCLFMRQAGSNAYSLYGVWSPDSI